MFLFYLVESFFVTVLFSFLCNPSECFLSSISRRVFFWYVLYGRERFFFGDRGGKSFLVEHKHTNERDILRENT